MTSYLPPDGFGLFYWVHYNQVLRISLILIRLTYYLISFPISGECQHRHLSAVLRYQINKNVNILGFALNRIYVKMC